MSQRVKSSTKKSNAAVATDSIKVNVKSTPIKNGDDFVERKKPKSSMKKLKTFLKSRSKAKNTDGPVEHLESEPARESRNNLNKKVKKVKLQKTASTTESTVNGHTDVRSSKRGRGDDIARHGNDQPAKRCRPNDLGDGKNKCSKSGSVSSLLPSSSKSSIVNSDPNPPSVLKSKSGCQNFLTDAERLFKRIISPVTVPTFFKDIWERKPLLVRRHDRHHNDNWFSTDELDHILREESVKFTDNIDVVTYLNGKRETHNPDGRAYAPLVWDFYQNGCSVRLLNPHTYSHNIWRALSMLQEYFGCVAGANIYLTPPGTQGFAPHWDDIEAFILQLEGKKHWRVYEPRNESEVLPRESSPNFSDADLTGPPVIDAILEPGDLLYFPRGFIHQGNTFEESHSLHITLSVGQKNTWGDLLQMLLPRALEVAMDEDVQFRQSLPRNYLSYMGVAFSDETSVERSKFLKTVEHLVSKLLPVAPVDAACDQMAKQFLQNTLPPVLTEGEQQCSIHGNGEHWDVKSNRVRGAVEIEPDTEIRVIRRGAIRLITEDEKVFIYHNMENPRMLHNEDIQCIEVEPQMAEAVEFLLKHYPEYVAVDNLPLEAVQERVALAADLYDRGLIMTSEPMLSPSDLDSESDQSDSAESS